MEWKSERTGWALYSFGIEAGVRAWGNFEIYATQTSSHQVFFPRLHQGLPSRSLLSLPTCTVLTCHLNLQICSTVSNCQTTTPLNGQGSIPALARFEPFSESRSPLHPQTSSNTSTWVLMGAAGHQNQCVPFNLLCVPINLSFSIIFPSLVTPYQLLYTTAAVSAGSSGSNATCPPSPLQEEVLGRPHQHPSSCRLPHAESVHDRKRNMDALTLVCSNTSATGAFWVARM